MKTSCASQGIRIVPDRVLFSILKSTPRQSPDVFYFSIESDRQFQYSAFADDFGPPALPQLCLFYKLMEGILLSRKEIIHFYTSRAPRWKTNACLYICFFRMLHLSLTADAAYYPISALSGALCPFRDASSLASIYDLTVLDCLRGVEKAIARSWFNADSFDAANWSKMELMENGGMNWIIPGKLLAFASPYSMNDLPNGTRVATASDLVSVLRILGITHVTA
jgi:cell division cycle 14